MKKAAVLFHSVCGNTYLLAKRYAEALEHCGVEVALYRAADPSFEQYVEQFPVARQHAGEIRAVPALEDIRALLDCDAIFLGSPTYFGNVSAAVKSLMDSLCDFWAEAQLGGKWFGAFASMGSEHGGGESCLRAMDVFAMHMGMNVLPVTANNGGAIQPAYGVLHYCGDGGDLRPDSGTFTAIDNYIKRVSAL